MANYKAVVNGNWSSLATRQDDSSWSFLASTVLPWISDTVYTNNKIVTIDQNVSVVALDNRSTTWVTAWGYFTITSNVDTTIIADLYCSANIDLFFITSANTTNTITIIWDCVYVWLQSRHINYDGKWTLDYYGNIQCTSYTQYPINITRWGSTLNFYGNINRVADNRSYWIYCCPTNEPELKNYVNIVWNMSDWPARWFYFKKINTSNELEFTFEGNIDTSDWHWGIELVQWYITWYINNSIFEWTCFALDVYFSATNFNPNSKITLTNVSMNQTGNQWPLIYSITTWWVHLHFKDCDINQTWTPCFPICAGYATFEYTVPKSWQLINDNNSPTYMYSSYVWNPTESDVRDWTVYWWNSELEWTLVVPSPSNVASGVPTDDTVWTADFNLSEVMTALWVVNEWVQKASKFIPHTTNL